MRKSRIGVFSVIALLLLSLSVSLAASQTPYAATKTTEVTIGANGLFIASETSIGVMYTIEGTPGAEGTVTTVVYSGNPQATAVVPSGVSLSHFIAITFDIGASDFISATLTVSYSDNDVAGLNEPYSLYKYLPDGDIYVALSTDVDTTAKTMTTTLNSVNDPILAVGGLTAETPPDMTTSWVVAAVAIVLIVVLAVFLVIRWRRM